MNGEKMTKKRANGEGSVYRRKDGRVVGEWTDTHGQTKHTTSTKTNENQMRAAIRNRLEDGDNGVAKPLRARACHTANEADDPKKTDRFGA